MNSNDEAQVAQRQSYPRYQELSRSRRQAAFSVSDQINIIDAPTNDYIMMFVPIHDPSAPEKGVFEMKLLTAPDSTLIKHWYTRGNDDSCAERLVIAFSPDVSESSETSPVTTWQDFGEVALVGIDPIRVDDDALLIFLISFIVPPPQGWRYHRLSILADEDTAKLANAIIDGVHDLRPGLKADSAIRQGKRWPELAA